MSGALAVILARAGSRGLPGKNAAPVAGRPCVAWTIDDALRARTVWRVVVSTDCPDVAGAARAAGVEVVERPVELAHDAARVDDAARHAALVADPGRVSTHIVLLYANVPVRPPDLIDRACDTLAQSGCDSVQSYAPVGKHHPWWTIRLDDDGAPPRPWTGDTLYHGVFRRQDLPTAYVPDGGVIALRRAALDLELPGVDRAHPHAFLGPNQRGVRTQIGDVIDIDSRIDQLVADATLRQRLAAQQEHAA